MKNRRKSKNIPDHIILNILNEETCAESEIINHYEGYIREVATEPVYSKEGNRTGYYYDEDLAQELRLALSQALPALRETLIKNHLEKRPVIVVLGQLTD